MTESQLRQFAEEIANFRDEAFYGGREAAVQAVLAELRQHGYENAGPGFQIKEPWYKAKRYTRGEWVRL